jgi:enoyl-CoA hydratase
VYENYKLLKLEKRGAVLVITMDNPPLNAVNGQMHEELSRIFVEINTDPETNVVVVTGAGAKAFSAGGDITRMKTRIETRDQEGWRVLVREAQNIVYSLLRLEKPLIGRVNGHAMGLGATLAAFCDISFMMADAKIADTHVAVGLTAGDGGALMWPLLMGFQKAKRYLLTGDQMTGREAADMGLITAAVETVEDLDREVFTLADRIASGASLAINTTKMAANLTLRKLLEGQVETHLSYETQTVWSDDHREAVSSFLEKRTPKFSGK